MIYVIGHKNPDTDSICSAIGYAAFKSALTGEEFVPARAGELNPETTFVLKRFGAEAPVFLESAAGKDIILVDHNETAQAVDNVAEANIREIIDHHKIGDVQTKDPIYFRNMPVGCSATIVYLHFTENNLAPDKTTAGLLLSAILSDTLAFRSPTCTEMDVKTADALAQIAGIEDIQGYAKEMFKAGSELAGKTPKEILYLDFKKFTAGDTTYGVGQVTSMDADELAELKGTMTEYMNSSFDEHGVDMLFLLLTDILDESSEMLCAGKNADETVQKAFTSAEEGRYYLKGVVSRKKQVIPALTEALS
ncbi:MAG: putative manganese-dependent inorganic diphosphatase [Firmicutes bacterium]|nr:putative manganese-dependent inorganic diphosphatase [Bacillota bacterium]